MSTSEGEAEVFSPAPGSGTGASPELRRSSRTSARKRASTGSAPYSRPKSKKKMQTVRSPVKSSEMDRPIGAQPAVNPFASLGGSAPQAGQDTFLAQMQNVMGGMLGGMETRLSKASNELRTSVDQALSSIGDLNTRMEASEKRMDRVVVDMEAMVEKKVEEGLRQFSLPGSGGAVGGAGEAGGMEDEQTTGSTSMSYAAALMSRGPRLDPLERKEAEYWKCRRSLRLRPVGAGTDQEAAVNYMRDYLKLDGAFIEMSRGKFTAQRVPFGPKAKFKNEILVTFDTVEARDVVRGAATNLAGKGQEYGVRLEIPNHLRSAMKALQTVSYELRQRNQEARRNILFDDNAMDLVLDFQLQPTAPWRRVSSAQAKAKREKFVGPTSNLAIGDDELDNILDKNVQEERMEDP